MTICFCAWQLGTIRQVLTSMVKYGVDYHSGSGVGEMFIAINEDGKRVYASKDLPRDIRYFCPVCKGEVRLRAGSLNATHFAHIELQDCADDFTHDMSEWHKAWQMLFPLGNREVVITHENETHRADVLCYGTVIEFQHSILESTFCGFKNPIQCS